ncbi:family 15 carbohydrate-binding domain-containing protein [Marinimicrobium agarilyticum]|uniref:family 15 carbohydrate-binding domain-containing protein n=1 Tax=Marinimicrobium agarilyticum TaxID=306546 RepID=UPI0004167F32|nr:family 15 carbohydrate-binding domain-containing protein [Marinimicrobium agarilyticum]
MLQKKLVIAMCAIFALSACGGDDNDDQSRIVLNPPEDLNPPTEEEPEEEEPGEDDSVEWLNATFDEETSVNSWEVACVSSECNATATLAYNADAQAMDVTPDFLSASDQIEISTAIEPEIADLAGGNAHLNLYVPEAYAGMVAQIFFQDASDRKGYIGYTNTTAGWNTFSVEALEAGTGVDDDFGSFGFHSEGFDLTLINRMGVQIQSAEGFPDLEGTLHIDDAIVSPEAIEVADKVVEEEPSGEEPIAGAPEEPAAGDISDHFTDDIEGWHLNGTGNTTTAETAQIALTHDAVNGALKITPKSWEANASESYRYESRIALAAATDLTNALVRMVVYIPEAYITDGSLQLQLVAGGSYGDYIPNLTAGFNTLDIDLSQRTDDLTAVETLGLQISAAPTDTSILEPILVSSFDVYLDGTVPATEISVDMTTGWRVNPTGLMMSYTADGVSYQPTAASDQLVFDPAGPLNMAGGSIDFVYEVDQTFIDSGANLQPFFQLKEYADYDYHFCWIGNADLATGEQSFTCEVPETLENGTAAQIPDGQTAQVGVQTNGGGAGTVTIKSVTIHPAE